MQTGVIDRELISPEALFDMKSQLDEAYLPLTIEHDIRNPPIGRIVSGEIFELEDGNYLLQGEAEVFDESVESLKISTEKAIRIYAKEIETFEASYDGRLHSDELENLRNELDPIATNSWESRKYSAEPQNVVLIAFGVFAISSIAGGFFKNIGSDIYDILKHSLKKYFSRDSKSDTQEELLQLQYFIKSDSGRDIELNVVITNPSADDIDQSFNSLPEAIENLVGRLPIDINSVCRIVLSYKLSKLKVLYLLRSDGVPLSVKIHEQ